EWHARIRIRVPGDRSDLFVYRLRCRSLADETAICLPACPHLVTLPGIGVICLALGEDRPDHTGMLVGNRHQRFVVTHTQIQLHNPLLDSGEVRRLAFERHAYTGARTLDQQGAQISVPTPADMAELGLAAAGILPRSQSLPSGELTSVLKVPSIAHGGGDRIGGEYANAGEGLDTLCAHATACLFGDRAIAQGELFVQRSKLPLQRFQQAAQ